SGRGEPGPDSRKKRAKRETPSSGETKRASPCCRWRCAPGRPQATRRCCGANAPTTISRPAAASRSTGACSCRGENRRATPRAWWASCGCGSRTVRGRVLVIWDRSPLHTGQPIPEYLAQGAATRPHLERLPGYAPDRNPDEGIWKYLKRVELKTRCCGDLAELRVELRRANERPRHKRHIIRSCSTHCGYSV